MNLSNEIATSIFPNTLTTKSIDELKSLEEISAKIALIRQDLRDFIRDENENMNAFFLVFMALFIFLMQCGFAFLEAGSVRSKNVTNILTKNVLDSLLTIIGYWSVGWALAYGPNFIPHGPYSQFFGFSQFVGIGLFDFSRFFFQYVFAARASTIISGAVAERAEFITFVVYSIIVSAFVYPILSHWCWADHGWLKHGIPIGNDFRTTYIDFAGAGVVHLCGGTIGILAAVLIGPRIGRFRNSSYYNTEANSSLKNNGNGNGSVKLEGHSVPLASLGGFILMLGFLAFNGGSQGNITNPGNGQMVAKSMVNTLLCGAFAALTCLTIHFRRHGRWTVLLTINGCLAGMIASCAGCNQMNGWGCLFTGIGAGIVYQSLSDLLIRLKIDDPLDAFAVHAGGGLWGLFAVCIVRVESNIAERNGTSLLPSGAGLLTEVIHSSGGNAILKALSQLAWNLIGGAAIILWSCVIMLPVFFALKLFRIFRVPTEMEHKGVDIYMHGEEAYPVSAYGHGWEEEEGNGCSSNGCEFEMSNNNNNNHRKIPLTGQNDSESKTPPNRNGTSQKLAKNENEHWKPTAVIYHDPNRYK